jgi:hypothetical protein
VAVIAPAIPLLVQHDTATTDLATRALAAIRAGIADNRAAVAASDNMRQEMERHTWRL